MAQIKSKERVRDLAEVYTNEREVKAMLDLIPLKMPDDIITYKYLEPACGNGNFLIEILRRKLDRVNEKYLNSPLSIYEFYIARSLTTIYGIDICGENINEAKERLFIEVKSTFDMHKGSFIYTEGFLSTVRYILEKNIVIGDSINKPDEIYFTEFKVKGKQFEQRIYRFSELTEKHPSPISVLPKKHYLSIGLEYQEEKGIVYEGKQRHLNFV
jgi:hypothetical protein